MYEVMRQEPWMYRSDLVAMRKVHEPAQLTLDFVNHISLWTQFHNVPPEMLSHEGIVYLASDLGIPVSEVRQGYCAGKLFMRIKITFPSTDSLKDRMYVEHPTLGVTTVFLVYERAPRLCFYCAKVGHEISGCPKRGQALQLFSDPLYANRLEMGFILEHRMGPWMTCMNLVPRPAPETSPFHPNPTPPAAPIPELNTPVYVPSDTNTNITSGFTTNQEHENRMPSPYSNPNEASPLHNPNLNPPLQGSRVTPELRVAIHGRRQLGAAAGASGSASPSSRARALTINEHGGPNASTSPCNGSTSPPPSFHKKLRTVSPESPSGAK